MNNLPTNSLATSLFELLWADGADGEALMQGFLGSLRDIAEREGGQEEIHRLAETFRTGNVVQRTVD